MTECGQMTVRQKSIDSEKTIIKIEPIRTIRKNLFKFTKISTKSLVNCDTLVKIEEKSKSFKELGILDEL